jgi:ribose transport system ATP-binding protein
MTVPLLEVFDIRKSFPGVQALKGISFSILPGEIHALVGENGAGKSTLVKIITGVYRFDSGSMRLSGRPIHPETPDEAQDLGISVIHQELSVVPTISAAHNIVICREPVKKSVLGRLFGVIAYDDVFSKCEPIAEAVGLDRACLSKPAGHLSVGEQQLVEIARGLSMDAQLIIMDEPTTALSESEVQRLFKVVLSLKAQGKSVLYISHKLDEIAEIADRATVIRDGQVVGTVNLCDTTTNDIVRMMVGREILDIYPKLEEPDTEEALRVEGLSSLLGSFDNVTFSLRSGEILGVTGLLGCGSTNVARALFGLEPISSGDIYVRGKKVRIDSPSQAILLGLGYLTDDRMSDGFVPLLPISSNIGLASLDTFTRMGMVNNTRLRDVASEYVSGLRIQTPSVDTPVKNLSGGNQQKVVLAKWLLSKARLIICDEPTKGIDVGARVEVYELIANLAAEGASIILISTDVDEVISMSHRVMAMRRGKIVGAFDSQDITLQEVLESIAGGESK